MQGTTKLNNFDKLMTTTTTNNFISSSPPNASRIVKHPTSSQPSPLAKNDNDIAPSSPISENNNNAQQNEGDVEVIPAISNDNILPLLKYMVM
jgi:hypothetical protein